jgi:hypothetical protein
MGRDIAASEGSHGMETYAWQGETDFGQRGPKLSYVSHWMIPKPDCSRETVEIGLRTTEP